MRTPPAPPGLSPDGGVRQRRWTRLLFSYPLLAYRLEPRQGQLEGFSGAGFKIVTREDIEGAAGEDEELAAALAACKEADPPNPIPPDVYAKLLKNLLGEAAPAEPPALSAEGPVGKLIQVDKGPRCFKVFINDFPLRQDMPTLEASLEGGTLDLVVLVTAPPPPPPLPPADGEEAAAEPPPEPSEEEKAATEQLLAEGRAREKLFADFQEFVRVETTAQSGRCSHKLVANVCFDTLELVASDPAAGTYCDAEASMEALGRKMLQIIQAKFEWMGYMAPLQRIETQAEEINMRHYHQVLSAGPPSTVSVALILNALIEQVERLHPDMDNTCLSVAKRGFATASAPTDCAQPPHHHPDVAERVNNLKIEDALEEALYTLNAELPKRNNLELPNRRMDIPLVLQGDKQSQRIGAPKVPQTQRDSWVAKEQAVNDLLDAVVRARVPAMHPEEPGMTEAEIGLEMTELVTMLPDTLSPSQIKRGLVLAEMERLVNFITDDKGDAINVNAWFMEEISLAPYTMVEEHGPEALKQILREAFEAPHGINPTVKATYYAREDLILALVCNHVPFSRQQNLVWKAVNRGETSVRCFLGFWQWLETRFVFRKEDNDAREAEQRALLAEQEAGMDSIGAVEEEKGEEEAPEEVSEEELERRRIEAEEKEAEALRLEQLKEALPELALPRSGTWYEMDAKKALRIQESRDVCFLSHGPRVCMTKVGQQRILTVDAARHTLVMRQDQDDTFKLTLTYEDGACAMARREDGQTVVSVSMPEGLMVTLRSDGTVWQSRPKSKV